MNRNYELMFIVRPDMVDEDLNKLISTLESSVTSAGGTTKSEVWGKRRLAYRVGRFNDGIFVLMLIDGVRRGRARSRTPPARDRAGDQVPHRAHGRRTEAARQDQEAPRLEEESQRATGRNRCSGNTGNAGSRQRKHRPRRRFNRQIRFGWAQLVSRLRGRTSRRPLTNS